jgi:hypothetical protein
MRRNLFITLFITVLCINSFSQTGKEYTIDRLFDEFKKEKNIEKVKINGFVMKFAGFFSDTKGVTSVEVCSLDGCEDVVKQRFGKAFKNIKDNSYETMLSNNEDGNRTKIMIRTDEDIIKEIVVLADGKDPTLIRIKGKIKADDIQSIVKDNSKK